MESLFDGYTSVWSCHRLVLRQGGAAEVLHILWSMLGMIKGGFDTREKSLWTMTLNVVNKLIEILLKLGKSDDPLLNVDTIKTFLQSILATDQFHLDDRESPDGDQIWRHMNSMIDLIEMLTDRPQVLIKKSMEYLSVLVRQYQRRRLYKGSLLLHLACEDRRNINLLATLRLLLLVGANPDTADDDGNRPFHILACYDPTNEAAARVLLNSGAFLCRLNNGGFTTVDVWSEHNRLDEDLPISYGFGITVQCRS